MRGEIYRIRGDVVEIFYDPRWGEPKVGESLILKEKKGGILVQVIELRSPPFSPPLEEEDEEKAIRKGLKIALCKIRKTLKGKEFSAWEGWIPGREIDISPLSGEPLLFRTPENPIFLGRTIKGDPFLVEAAFLEKVNIITGVKGSGKSHLAKVILLGLVKKGAPCVVFDINREYIGLGKGVVHLDVGGKFKMGVREMGIGPISTMLSSFGLPSPSLIYFENRLSQLLREAEVLERKGMPVPFIGINQLIQLAEKGEYYQSEGEAEGVVNRTIRSRLEAIRHTGVLASRPDEVGSFYKEYQKIKYGGALAVDLSRLSTPARRGFVQAAIDILIDIAEEEGEGEGRFPFLFFEEAHLYVPHGTIDRLVSRARHFGITSFFITNTITGLDEAVLRQADNLFIFPLPLEEDIRHVSKSALTDLETIASLNKKLKPFSCLVIGEVTQRYPSILEVDPLPGVETRGETKYFFKKAEPEKVSQLSLWR